MKIHGYNGLTLLDYPGRLACVIFTGCCNYRCPFCHNAELVLRPDEQPALDPDRLINDIVHKSGKIEGVVITGGEPTLQRDLPDFLRKLKDASGLPVKLDTNGTDPEMLKALAGEGLIDYIAMDIKAAPDRYHTATGLECVSMSEIFESVDFIMQNGLEYEFRTTVVDGIHTKDDFIKIGKWIKGACRYYLQPYKDSGDLISPAGLSAPTPEMLEEYRHILLPYIPDTILRGVG